MNSYKGIKTIEQVKARMEKLGVNSTQYEFLQFENGVQLLTDSQYGKIAISSRNGPFYSQGSYGGEEGFFEVRLISGDNTNGLEKLLNKPGCFVVGCLTLSEALGIVRTIKLYPLESLKRLVEEYL